MADTEGAPAPSPSLHLEALKEQVTTLGDKLKSLKSTDSTADKSEISAAVQQLLAAKRAYADQNNGIGVDGKPYEPPLTKQQKKEKAKAEKGPAKETPNPNSANAQKKAAKKAAAKAKKAELKADPGGGGAEVPTAPVGTPDMPLPTTAITSSIPKKRVATKLPPPASSKQKVLPHQIVINPNATDLKDRPVVALTLAILTNTLLDYDIVSDHLSRQTYMGLPNKSGEGVVLGDYAMARYIVRNANSDEETVPLSPSVLLGGSSLARQAVVDAYVDYAQSLSVLPWEQRMRAVGMTLEHALGQDTTYLAGDTITIADVCLFGVLGFPSQSLDLERVLRAWSAPTATLVAACRWVGMLAQCPAIQEATQCAIGVVQNAEAVFSSLSSCALEPLAPGMNTLEGGTPGRVVTRFPPEPSGYLHIGHAKAVLLNDYYARRYKGRLIVRFDDTNPSKEKGEFEEAIVEDLAMLHVTPDIITYTSDYFDTVRGYAEWMIRNGLAYMDDTPQEQMKVERMERTNSVHRHQTVDVCMGHFVTMCSGAEEGAKWCLRAKIDMQSVNGTMRDPVIYRQNLAPHHRSGEKFKAYPTYDLACPIVDSLEGVTHALRTTEYNDRDEQYQWFQMTLGLRRTRIHGFARMNFVNTVLSKRKLTWFVENGYVTGWDDPRFPTVRGVVNRGLNISALRDFMYSQGASRRVVNMEWSKFWAENKKELDKTAKRYMAIDKEQYTVLTISNAPQASANSFVSTDFHPKNPSLGKRVVRLANRVLLENIDAETIEAKENIVLVRWGVVNITKVEGGLEGTYVPDSDIKAAKRKLSWIADVPENTACILTEFDNLVTKEKLEEGDNFEDYINPNTMAVTDVMGDAGLKTLEEHEVIQLERRGYYRVNRPYVSKDKPLVLYMVPDGKSKSMGGLSGKLGHR